MKVPVKVLYASYLPKVKDRDKILAAKSGMNLDGQPPIRNLLSSVPDEYLDNLDKIGQNPYGNPSNPNNTQLGSNYQQPSILAHAPTQINPYSGLNLNLPQQKKKQPYQGEIGQGIVTAGAIADAIIPYDKIKRYPTVRPELGYNPHPYGTGSQSLMEYGGEVPEAGSGHWIQKAVNPKHKGYCTPMTKSTCTPRRKALARTFKKHHGFHEDGGIISAEGQQSAIPAWTLKSGGSLSPGKAAEILHDGTAHGHALTPKQRRFMGWKSHQKAPEGTAIGGDPKKNVLMNSAIGENTVGNIQNSLSRRPTNMLDNVNYTLTHGGARTPGLGTLDPNETQLMTDAYIWSQRADMKGKNPQNIVSSYFGRPVNASNPVDALRSSLNQINQGAVSDYNQTPNVSVRDPRVIQPASPSLASMKMGGMMYADGGAIQTHWGGNAEPIAFNPYDGGTAQFNGDSHAKGGIGMSFNNKGVEVEGGETAARDIDGNLNIFGNMRIPATNTKFKTASKEIAEKEIAMDKLKTKGTNTVNDLTPRNKYDQIKFNAAEVMMKGGDMGQKLLAKKKQQLADLQNAMLDTAKEFNLDPQGMSQGNLKKAKKGTWMKAPFGIHIGDNAEANSTGTGDDPKKKKKKRPSVIAEDYPYTDPYDPSYVPPTTNTGYNDPTRSDRNNSPGNIKYVKGAKWMGAIGQDAQGFAKFANRDAGFAAMKKQLGRDLYNNLPVDEAIKKWTEGSPYRYNLPDDFKGSDGKLKKINQLSPTQIDKLTNIMATGEGTRYGAPKISLPDVPIGERPSGSPTPKTITPYGLPTAPPWAEVKPDEPVEKAVPPWLFPDTPQNKKDIPTQAKPLGFGDVASDIFAISQNQERPVYAQKYVPDLYEPYQVSFQDRINDNDQSFNNIQRLVGSTNPTALGSLAGQKYSADNAVRAEEFRTNQGISNQITNENRALMNESQRFNLGVADQQFTRQELANAKTREMNQIIANSLSDKYNAVKYRNNELRAYENLYNFRLQENPKTGGLEETNYNPDQRFDFTSGRGAGGGGYDNTRTITNYNKDNSVKNYRTVTDSDLSTQIKEATLEYKRRKLQEQQTGIKFFRGGYIK